MHSMLLAAPDPITENNPIMMKSIPSRPLFRPK